MRLTANDWQHLVDRVRAVTLQDAGPDSCILTIAGLAQVLEVWGIEATPLPVEVAIFSPEMLPCFQPGKRWPEGAELKRQLQRRHAYSVGLGYGKKVLPGKWAGHLVAIVSLGETILMLDPSLDQASRPRHRMVLHPLVQEASSDFVAGNAQMVLRMNDCTLFYHAKPHHHTYTSAPDWLYAERRLKIAQAVLSRWED